MTKEELIKTLRSFQTDEQLINLIKTSCFAEGYKSAQMEYKHFKAEDRHIWQEAVFDYFNQLTDK